MLNNNSKKKVILINGKDSNWYEQAIFIVNENGFGMPTDMVKEAENIIKKYIAQGGEAPREHFSAYKRNMPKAKNKQKAVKSGSGADKVINFALLMSMALICVLMYLVFKL